MTPDASNGRNPMHKIKVFAFSAALLGAALLPAAAEAKASWT
jgi:hypothetical protein